MNPHDDPCGHLNKRQMWDQHLAELPTGQWVMQATCILDSSWWAKYIGLPEFILALDELRNITEGRGVPYCCCHCASRVTQHDCRTCETQVKEKQ